MTPAQRKLARVALDPAEMAPAIDFTGFAKAIIRKRNTNQNAVHHQRP